VELGTIAPGRTTKSSERGLRWSRLAIVAAVLVACIGAAALGFARRQPPVAATPPAPKFLGSDLPAPTGARVAVEVFNATHTHGLGRRAVMYLRDRGYDVVEWGTSPELRDTTIVIDRSGHADWARLVARTLGAARVETHRDSSRYVDISVFIGSTWRPPPQPFYP
jgi:hypothetical protein